jgi:hypothetical protein
LTVYWRGGEVTLGENTKPVVARQLIDLIAERYHGSRRKAPVTSRAV